MTVQLRSREHTYQHQKSLNRQHKAQYLTFCSIRYVVYKNDENYRPLDTPPRGTPEVIGARKIFSNARMQFAKESAGAQFIEI